MEDERGVLNETDGVDFDYLMALIYNSVGPNTIDKDLTTLSASMNELYTIDEMNHSLRNDGMSSSEDGEIDFIPQENDICENDTDTLNSFSNRVRSTPLMQPLSPDCLSPRTQLDRIHAPRLENLEPHPPTRRPYHSIVPNENILYPVAAPRNHIRQLKESYVPLNQTILSDYSEDESEHDITSSDEEGEVETRGNVVEWSRSIEGIPHQLFQHLVAMGFQPARTHSAFQSCLNELNENNNSPRDIDLFFRLIQGVITAHNDHNERSTTKPTTNTKFNLESQDTTFPWPVFDMAQYEFGTARPGTSFDCVVVVVNLPKISLGEDFDRLHDLFLHQIFSMVSNPIQVILPVLPTMNMIKGHGFLEFQNRDDATLAARSLDGLQWNFNDIPIRSMLFREYHGSQSNELTALDLISEEEDENHHLNQRNEQLEYLIRYIEQDRDAVLLENEELKYMMEKYHQREKQQENALNNLNHLRKRIEINEEKYRIHMKESKENEKNIEIMRQRLQELTGHTPSLHILTIPELRDLEDILDTALYKARAIREEKIINQRQELDRQVQIQEEEKLCVICLACKKTILCLPCRHVCMCESCSKHCEILRCPICRIDIIEKMLIYS